MKWKGPWTMAWRRGEIYLVNFNPQKRVQEVGKVRPALVVSDTELNEILDLVTVVPLTTNVIPDTEPLRIHFPPRERLERPSDAMVEQLRAVSKERIGERIASVTSEEMEKVSHGIRTMLAID